MVNIDMGGNTEFLTVSPGQAGPSNYPPGFFIGSSSALTPTTSPTQATAAPITTQQVVVNSTVVAGGVVLPPAIAGAEVIVYNSGTGTNTIRVYGNGSDTVNGVAGSTGVVQAITTVTIYYCFVTGAWIGK